MEYMEALRAYWERFGERFPTECEGSEADIVAKVEACLESGEPYDPGYEDGALR